MTVRARGREYQRVAPVAGSMMPLECIEGLVEVARIGDRMCRGAEPFAQRMS